MSVPIDALKALVAKISGVQTIWNTEPRPNLAAAPGGRRAYIEARLGALVQPGNDDYLESYDADAQRILVNLAGYRIFTLSLRATSLDPTLQAFDLLEQVRRRLGGTLTGRDGLARAGIAFVDAAPVQPVIASLDNRAALAAVLDVRLAMVSQGDPGDDDGGIIKTVNGDNMIPRVDS